jgi:cellulose synthase operon protein C
VGGFLAVKRPWVKKPPPLAKKVDTPSAPIEAMVGEWRLRYPELTGTAAEYVDQGDEQMARDTTQGYARAEEAYQRALVLDSRNDRAVAGWVLALAFGRFGQIDERTGAAAEAMVGSAERRTSDSRVFAAHAHLMLARSGNFNDIKVLAEQALKSASEKDKALGYLALGQAYLGKNQLYAADYFEKAANADPKLKRAVLYQAQLLVQQGELKKAMDSLDKKLTADPDQWEAADMLARLYVEAGEPAKARKAYLQVPSAAKDPRAQMTLAILSYQHEGQPAAAVKTLEAVLADEEQVDAQDVITALGHLAAAKRVAGDLDGAAGAASRALDKRPGDLNALVQRFLISIERNKAADARGQLQPLAGRLNDPALELVFSGLVELIDGRAPEAQRQFVKAWETDPRRADALLLAGAAAARAKVDGKAWEYALKQGLKADPWRAAPLAVMAPVYVRAADVLKPARGAFEPLARDDEDPNPPLAEGLLAWFSDDHDAAAKLFDRVVHIDPNNGAGFAYRSFVALKKGQASGAEKLAEKGIRGDRAQPLAHLAMGLSLLGQNKLEPSKKALTRAAELAPAMLLPRAKLGEINGRQKRPDEARKALTAVLLNDPLYREARRAQYLGGS